MLDHRNSTSSLNNEAKRSSDPRNKFKCTKWFVNLYVLSATKYTLFICVRRYGGKGACSSRQEQRVSKTFEPTSLRLLFYSSPNCLFVGQTLSFYGMQDKYGSTKLMQLYVPAFTFAPPTDTLQHTQLSLLPTCMIDLLRFISYDRLTRTFNRPNLIFLI